MTRKASSLVRLHVVLALLLVELALLLRGRILILLVLGHLDTECGNKNKIRRGTKAKRAGLGNRATPPPDKKATRKINTEGIPGSNEPHKINKTNVGGNEAEGLGIKETPTKEKQRGKQKQSEGAPGIKQTSRRIKTKQRGGNKAEGSRRPPRCFHYHRLYSAPSHPVPPSHFIPRPSPVHLDVSFFCFFLFPHRDQVVHVRLRFGELHLVHALTGVPRYSVFVRCCFP